MSKLVQPAPATLSTVAGDPSKLLRPTLQSITLYLLVIMIAMMGMVKPVHAAGGVPFGQECGAFALGYNITQAGGYLTPALACQRVSAWWGTTGCVPNGAGNCINCASGSGGYYSCGRAPCPAHSKSNGSSCACDDPTEFDPNTYVPEEPAKISCVPLICDTSTHKIEGTSCVLACTFTKVADVTDPVAKLYEDGTYSNTKPDIEHLTQETQAGLACIQQKVAAANCYMTPQPTSGYRPTAYQTHILEVYDKWQEIKDNNAPECAETKTAIQKEFNKHSRFARRPGVTSNHSQVDAQGNPAGEAVDISFVPDDTNASADTIACQCNMFRPLINMPDPTKNDPVHYQPRTCPR